MAWPLAPRHRPERAGDLRAQFLRLELPVLVCAAALVLVPALARWTSLRPAVVAPALLFLLAVRALRASKVASRWPRAYASLDCLALTLALAAPAVSAADPGSGLWGLFLLAPFLLAREYGPTMVGLVLLAAAPVLGGRFAPVLGLPPPSSLSPLLTQGLVAILLFAMMADIYLLNWTWTEKLALQSVRAAADLERRRIGRQLHEQLGAALAEIGRHQESAAAAPQGSQEALAAAHARARAALGELRAAVHALDPRDVEPAALFAQLRRRLLDLLEMAGVPLALTGAPPAAPVPAPSAYHLLKLLEGWALQARSASPRALAVEIRWDRARPTVIATLEQPKRHPDPRQLAELEVHARALGGRQSMSDCADQTVRLELTAELHPPPPSRPPREPNEPLAEAPQ